MPDASPGGDIGYAPYVDLIIPHNGADGSGTGSGSPENDGLTFVSATYLGTNLAATVIEFDADGQAVHPFARDASGNLRVVNAADYGAAPGDQLVVFQLPYGSFVPDQPAATINVTLDVSSYADLETPLQITAVGGFAYGTDPLNNPTVDPPLLGTPAVMQVTPSLFTLDKTFNGAENETATGPNFAKSYTITLDLAAGQQVTDLVLTDRLPNGIVVAVETLALSVPGTVTYDELTHSITVTLDGPLTGTDVTDDLSLTFDFYVAETMVPGDATTPVLDPLTGASRPLENDVAASAVWTPIDPRDDPLTVTFDPDGPEEVFIARSIATQKTQAVIVDNNAGGLGPGDILEYTIDVQISDYFDFQNLVLNDLLSDGQRYLDGTARLEVMEGGLPVFAGAFADAFFVATRSPTNGQTTIAMNVSGQLVASGGDGVLNGGDGAAGATTLRITYQTEVQRYFVAPDGTVAVGQGDTLSNEADVSAGVVDETGTPTGGMPTDDTGSSSVIATGSVSKEIYALNGESVGSGPVQIVAGDLVTFRLTYTMPKTLTQELRLTDFLPLPVFDVDNFTLTLLDDLSGDPPAENVATWGPLAAGFRAELLDPLTGNLDPAKVPQLVVNSVANSLTFVFANLEPNVPSSTVADVLFTVRVTDRPFGDGLLLTNQVFAVEINTENTVSISEAITQVTLTEPILQITKGVVATDNASGTFSGSAGPVSFSPPGSAGARFTETIDSAALSAAPIDANLGNVDAGDLVTFAVVIENIGYGRDGAFDVAITDTLPPGFEVPVGGLGLNLQVTDGAGNAIAYTGDLFSGGIQLVDADGGAIKAYSPTGGANIVVITYDLILTNQVEARSEIVNTATVDNFAAFEGGIDRVPSTDTQTTDDASVGIAGPSIVKTTSATSVAETGYDAGNPNLADLTIGETITFDLTVTLQEGRTQDFIILDSLPAGLNFVSASLVSIGSNIFVRNADGTTGAGLGAPIVTASGGLITFTFADDIINRPDGVVTNADRIVVSVTAVATDVPGNAAGVVLTNTGTLSITDGTGQNLTLSDTEQAEIVEPSFELTKTASVETVQGGDIVTYTVRLVPVAASHAGPMFDITLTDDLLPGTLTLITGSITMIDAPAGTTTSDAGGIVTITVPVLLPGEEIVFTYEARVEQTAASGATLPNTVDLAGDSHPGTPPLGIERDYTDSATETVLVAMPKIEKTVSAADTSLPETGSSAYDPTRPDLAIGEVVTYTITVTMPEALSFNVRLSDVLPGAGGAAGLFGLISAEITHIGANLRDQNGDPLAAPSAAYIDSNGDLINDTTLFVLGDVLNLIDGVENDLDQITFTVTARVLDNAANVAGLAAVNTATVQTGDRTAAATATVDIVEPQIVLDKVASAPSGDAGDRISYEVRVPIGGLNAGPAFDVVVTDVIPAGITIDETTLRFANGALAGATLAYDAVTRTITATVPLYTSADPDIIIAYDVVVDDSVRHDDLLLNTADATWQSAPVGTPEARDGDSTDTNTLRIVLPAAIEKAVVATSLPETGDAFYNPDNPDAAIGELVTYEIRVTLGEGTQTVMVQDTLPAGLIFVSGEVVSIGGNITGTAIGVGALPVVSGQGITFDFGAAVVNAGDDNVMDGRDVIVMRVVARVLPGTVAGEAVLINAATFTTESGSYRDTAPVDVVKPAVTITKTPSSAIGDAGDEVEFVVVIEQAAGASAPLFDLEAEDTLPAGYVLVAGSASATRGTVAESGNTVRVTLGGAALMPVDDPLTAGDETRIVLTYRAVLVDAVEPGQVLTNTAGYTGVSAPGGGTTTETFTGTDTATVTVTMPVVIEKTIVATTNPDTGDGDVAQGETVTYRLVATLSEGTQTLVITDTLPPGMVLESASVTGIGAGLPQSLLSVANTGTGQNILFDFGTVVNTGNNIVTDGTVTIEVVARLQDATAIAAGTVLTNQAQATITSPTDPGAPGGTQTDDDNVPIVVVAPELTIAKTVVGLTGDAGDSFTYTVTVDHAAGSTAAAYDVVIEDLLEAVFAPVSVATTAGTAEIVGNTIRLTLPSFLITDAPVVLTYVVTFRDTVEPGQVVGNTATLAYDTNPGEGGLVKEGEASAPDVTGVFTLDLVKTIVDTSLPETGPNAGDPALTDVAIGETVTYRIVATLAEGTQTLVIADTLPDGMALISASVTGVGAGLPPGLLSVTNTGTGQGILFDFGTVVNTGNNLTTDGTVTIEVVARVLDATGNDAGTVLTNAATGTVTAPTDPTAPGGTLTDGDTASAIVVAPDVVITKTSTLTEGDAGDEITFTLVVSQQAAATGALYDLVVTDPIPAGMALVAGSVTTSRGTVTTGNGTGDAALRIDVAGLALAAADDAGTPEVNEASITITYRVRIADAAQPGQVIVNTATYQGLSAPEAGADGEARPYTGTDDATFTVVMPVTLDKQIYATSLDESGTDQGNDPAMTDLAVGETVTYRLTATLSEGTQTLVIGDTLPDGLEVLEARVISVGVGLPQDLMDTLAAVSGQSVSFDFGTVVNTGNNNTADGTVTVEIIARVRDIPSNAAGETLTNAGTVTIASPDNPQAPGGTQTDTDSTTAEIVEPELILDKTVQSGFAAPGEEITYTVTLSHTSDSSAAAYDIVLADLLTDPYLSLVVGSVSASPGSTITLGNNPGDTTVRIDLGTLVLGEVLTVSFTVRVADDAPGGVTFANTATADFDSAGGEGGRPDDVTDGTTTPGIPALVKEIFTTSNPDTGEGEFDPSIPDLEVGETVTYRLTITLPQGSIDNLVLSDLLPPSLQPLDARVVTVGAGLTAGAPVITISGQSVSLAFGTVVNGSGATIGAEDQIVVEVDALVVDLDGLAAGDLLVNAAEASFTIDGRDGTLDVSVPAQLVEPELAINKTVNELFGDAGDLFTYTVRVEHTATSTSAAYDLVIEDLLDGVIAPVSVSASMGTATITGNLIRVTLDSFLLTDAPLEITYVVSLRDMVEPGQVVGNTATLGYDSNPGTGGRPDAAEASAPDITAVFALNLTKTIVATSLPETGDDRFNPDAPDLAVGETVTYEIVATLSEGTQTLVITDLIPEGLLPLVGEAVVVSTGAGITAGAGGTLAPVAVIDGQRVTFDFGTLVNTGDNQSNAGDTVVVRITARVLDLPINTNGREVENDAEATIASPTDPTRPGGTVTDNDSALADIVVPRYLIDKAVDRTGDDAGDVFTYTLTVSPEANTDAPAFNLLIEDALSPFLVVVPGSLTSSVGTASIVGNTIRVEIPVMMPDAEPVIITYQAAFSDAIEPGQVVPNLAVLDYASAPNFARDLSDDAEASVRGEFDLSVTKEIVATSLPETGSGFFDPTLPDLAAGETVTYHLTVALFEGTQRLVVTDTLPPGLVAEGVSVFSVGAGIAAGAPTIVIVGNRITVDFGVVVNAGDNAGGDEIVIEVVARLNASQPAGTVLVNQAEAVATAPTDPSAPGGTLISADGASAESVAAVLVFDKNASPLSAGLGETITYTVTLSHAANSTAPAYEVVLFDPLSEASLQLINGTVFTSMGTVVLGNNGGDTGIRVVLPVLMPGEVLVVTFQARPVGIPIPDGLAVNTAGYDSTSAPGDIPPGFTRPLSGEDSATVQIVSGTPPEGGALFADYDDAFRRISRNTLNVPMILTGTAQPGAAVSLGLQDANGAPINIIGLTADVGGHWVASPIEPGAPGSAEVRASDGMDRLAGRQGSTGVAPSAVPASTTGLDLAAYTVQAAQAPAAFDVRSGMDGVRSTFAGVVHPSGAFVGAAESPGEAVAASVTGQLQRDMAGLTAPTSLAWNRFALDFAASTAAASMAGR